MYVDGEELIPEEFCQHCRVYLEVIGPPGPIHEPWCPDRPADPPKSREAILDEVREILGNIARGPDLF